MKKKFTYFAKRIALLAIVLLIGLLLYFCGRLIQSKSRVEDVALQIQKLPVPAMQSTSQLVSRVKSLGRINQPSEAPPENTPLTSIWQSLKAKADAGDAYSSCRLAMELQRCLMHEKFEIAAMERNEKRSKQASNNPNTTERDWVRIEGLQNKYTTNASVCSGFQNTENISSDEYILRAALLGHEGAMQFVATLPSVEAFTGSGNLDGVIARREYATQFLDELAHRGNESALFELARLHAGESWSNQLSIKDAPKISYPNAAVYAITADLLHQRRVATNPSTQPFSVVNFMSLDKRLSTAELQAAEAKANQLLASFPPADSEAESRKALIKEKYRGADARVAMCRQQ